MWVFRLVVLVLRMIWCILGKVIKIGEGGCGLGG